MNYLVTGGAGFIGSHITEHLLKRGHDVVIMDDLSSGSRENIRHFHDQDRVRFVQESITNPAALRTLCENVDGIFHEAAIASVVQSVNNPSATHDVNLTGTFSVLVAARDAGVKKVVFASSSAIYGDTPALPKKEDHLPSPRSPYAVSKLAGEEYMRVFSELYGIKTLSLRYFNVFGPRQDPKSDYAAVIPKFITRVLAGKNPIIYGDGTQTRDFIYVKDVAEANARAMECPAQGAYNIACGQRIDLNALAGIITDIIGTRTSPIYEPARSGDIHDSVADISRAREAFGFVPHYSVKTGLEETIQWYRERSSW